MFEPTKESMHILDRVRPAGDQFKILSVVYDTRLTMHEAVYQFCTEAGWRLKTLLRTQRFYSTRSLVRMFKCHILSFIEGATPAIYHAAPSILKPLDDILVDFISQAGISEEQSLCSFNLAPLGMRRDIAMLALLHKVSLGTAPEPICKLFRPRHGTLDSFDFGFSFQAHQRQLHDPVCFSHPPMVQRSVYGLIRVYNGLPSFILDAPAPKPFQNRLQKLAKDAAQASKANWQLMFHAS
jgi:hypothetical protein